MSIDWDALVLAPCAAIFGEPVTYYPSSGLTVQTSGIFNDRFREIKLEDGIQVDDLSIILSLRTAAVANSPTQNERLLIRGTLYVIVDVDPDGMGDLRITLRAATDADAAGLQGPLPARIGALDFSTPGNSGLIGTL